MFVEIGGLIKKGLGQDVIKKFSKKKEVITVGVAKGRAKDLFDINEFGDAGETEILTLIVTEESSDKTFDELYRFLKLDKKKQGIIYKYFPLHKITFNK